VENLLSSSLLSKDKKTKIYRTQTFPVVLHGCKTWSLMLKVFENTVLRRIFGLKRDKVIGE